MTNILSFGGGVDSTALLAIHLYRDEAAALTGRSREEIDAALPMFDAVVFSDPGAEFPKTYENIEIAAAICADAGLRFETVRKDGENIVEWLERLGNLPLLPGAGHVCSLKFKAEVLHKWAESQFAGTITWAIGIEANEGHRKFTSKETDTHQCIHPLVTLGFDRADCERILRHLWPVTVEKSSCFFCPFQTKEELKDLHDNHPDLWKKCEEIEENFKVMSVIKHQRWLDAVAAGKTDPNKRAPVGQWKKNSYAEGARLFAKSEKGSRKTVTEWGAEFEEAHTDANETNNVSIETNTNEKETNIMAKTYGWKGIERGLWDSRKFVCYAHPDYPQWQVYRPEGLNRPIRPYCFIGKSLPPELQRGFHNFTDIHNALQKLQNTRSAVDQKYNR